MVSEIQAVRPFNAAMISRSISNRLRRVARDVSFN